MTPASQLQTPPTRITIRQTFAELRARGQIGLLPFVPAGYPDLATTEAVLPAIQRAGANVIEIGIPFSDPIADGPVIQEAFTAALSRKLRLNDVFTSIGRVRQSVSIPLVAMVSYSIVFRYGLARFLSNAKLAGFDGLILPDLPPPEAQGVCDQVRSAGLDTILLVAPTTPPQRRAQIAAMCSGFVYYLSVAGITGERQQLPADLRENVRQIKTLTDRPVCVGFGISRAEHVKQLSELADGAIVGSAVVRRIKEHASESAESIAQAVADYCRELLSLVR